MTTKNYVECDWCGRRVDVKDHIESTDMIHIESIDMTYMRGIKEDENMRPWVNEGEKDLCPECLVPWVEEKLGEILINSFSLKCE